MSKRNRRKRSVSPAIAIVGDGFCEQIYFQQLREAEGIRNIQIRPELPNRSGKGGGFKRIFIKAEELAKEGYDRVFCLIDMDVVLYENNLTVYQTDKKRLENLSVTVIECNPCFEIWFLLQFLRTSHLFGGCGEVESALRQKTILTDYAKAKEYYLRKNLYLALRTYMHTNAIQNANWLETQQGPNQSERLPRCEVFKVIQSLLSL